MVVATALEVETGREAEVEIALEIAVVETALEIATVETVLEAVAEAEEVETSEAELFSMRISHRNIVSFGCVALTKERQQRRSMLASGPSCY